MKYRLTAKPGIVRVNRSVTVNIAPVVSDRRVVTPARAASALVAPALAPAPKLNQARPALSSVHQGHSANRITPLSNTKNNTKIIRRTHTKHVIDVEKRHPNLLKEDHDKLLSRYKDRVKALKDIGIGRVLVMVACGPSILQADLGKLRNNPNIDIMCINKPDKRVWPSKYWVFCDTSQHRRNSDLWGGYTGTPINSSAVRVRHPNQILVKNKGGKGFSKDLLQGYYIGRSTTYANMQVALYMGYDAIYIFGCDMCEVDGVLHFYGQNPDVPEENRKKRFALEAEYYTYAANQLSEQDRSRFTFCSSYNPWPFVERFKRLDQKIAVDRILQSC